MAIRFDKYRITRKVHIVDGNPVHTYDPEKVKAWIFEGLSRGKWVSLGREFTDVKSTMVEKAIEYRVSYSKTFRSERL